MARISMSVFKILISAFMLPDHPDNPEIYAEVFSHYIFYYCVAEF